MKKLEWEIIFKNTTFFIVDNKIEDYYQEEIDKRIKKISSQINSLLDDDGVLNFIKNEKDSLSTLITLLGISGERFNRIVSMIRVSHGHIFETEWNSSSGMRNKLLVNPQILDDVCELFKNGSSNEKYKALIPNLILQKFHIDDKTLKRVGDKEFLKELVQVKLNTEYNTKYKDAYHNLIFSKIQPIAFRYGLEISENITPEGCSYPAMLILKAGSKSIIVNESYNLTTGQGQTTYQGKLAEMYKVVRDNPDALLINILDGAGWIARGSDCRQIYHNCHHFLNLKTIDYIEQIIKDFYNIN